MTIQLNSSLESNISQMKYNSIVLAQPIELKKIIKNISDEDPLNITRQNVEPYLKINTNIKPLSKCNNKNIYPALLTRNLFRRKKIGQLSLKELLKLRKKPTMYAIHNNKQNPQ